jgi:hypothetical protein
MTSSTRTSALAHQGHPPKSNFIAARNWQFIVTYLARGYSQREWLGLIVLGNLGLEKGITPNSGPNPGGKLAM